MHAQMARVPEPLAEDSAELSEALAVARTQLDRGDFADAARWVRRAAEAADQAGRIARVATLARAAADLASIVHSRPTIPAPVSSQTRVVAPAPISVAPPPASTPSGFVLAAPSNVGRSVTPPPLPSMRVKKPTLLGASPSGTMVRPPPVRPVRVTPPPPAAGNEERIRVSVRVSVRDPALLVVRPLDEGAAVPPGAREAYLVMPAVAEREDDVTDLIDDVEAAGSVA